MSLENPNIWGHKSTGKFTADLIGWDDETGRRHPGTPEQGNRDVDGLIIRVTDPKDPERGKVFTIYKSAGTRNPDVNTWLRWIVDSARRLYVFDLSYDLE